MKCGDETDLTPLGVGIGHVFDCDGCGVQLRVALFGEATVGIDERERKEATNDRNDIAE
jgi:hypothetical protein